MYDETLGKIALLAVGDLRQRAVLPAALPRPRRHAAPHPDYAPQFADWNMVSSIGAFGFGLSQVYFLFFVACRSIAARAAKAAAEAVGRRRRARVDGARPAPFHTFETPPLVE